MKKILALILTLCLFLSLCGCSSAPSEEELQEKYTAAVELYDKKQYADALVAFEEIAAYSDSSDYIYSCVLITTARENFEGRFVWGASSEFEGDVSENDVYMNVWNPYDAYVIDFDAQTITLDFKSSTTEFETIRKFEILNSTTLRCKGFRGKTKDQATYVYFNYTEDGYTVTRTGDDYLPLTIVKTEPATTEQA